MSADVKRLQPRKLRLRWIEWVESLRYPTTIGPTNAPVWPTELIRPKAAAAAVSERKVVGIAQRLGNAEVAQK